MQNEAMRRPELMEAFLRQPAQIPGLYHGLPYHPDGYVFQTRNTLTIRQHAGVGIDEHLPIDAKVGTVDAIKSTMRGEHVRASRMAGLTEDDHLVQKALVAEYYGPTWQYAADVKREYALLQGINVSEVREDMLDNAAKKRLLDLREQAKIDMAHDPIASEIRAKQQKYFKVIERTRKVGIKPVGIEDTSEGMAVNVDVYPVPYALYAHLSTPELSEKSNQIGELLATGASIITDDSILIIQIRGEGNNIYADMLGTSAGGLKDGKFHPTIVGSVSETTTESIIENTRDEMDWEVGQDDVDTIKSIRIIGLIEEEDVIHTEALVHVESHMTFEEFARNAWIKKGRPSPRPGHEFSEDFVGIPADPDSILAFLAVPSPLPATHYGTIIGAGFMKEYERTGSIKAAEAWQRRAEQAVLESRVEMNAIVRAYWHANPEKAAVYKGDTTQYDPYFPAGMQGLGNAVEVVKARGITVHQWKPRT